MDQNYIAPASALKKLKKARNLSQTVYLYGATGYRRRSWYANICRAADTLTSPVRNCPGRMGRCPGRNRAGKTAGWW